MIYRKDGDFFLRFPEVGIKFYAFIWRYSESLVYWRDQSWIFLNIVIN